MRIIFFKHREMNISLFIKGCFSCPFELSGHETLQQ